MLYKGVEFYDYNMYSGSQATISSFWLKSIYTVSNCFPDVLEKESLKKSVCKL